MAFCINRTYCILLHSKFVSIMDAYKNAHVNTIDNVLLFLEQKKAEILPFAPAIGTDYLALIDKRAAIAVSLGNAYVTTTAVTERKQTTRQTVVTVGRRLAAAAVGYASSVNDPTLRREFERFKVELSAVKDADLSVVAGNLQKKLAEVAQHLADRGVSPDDLAHFEAATAQFKADAPTVKNTRDASSTENAEAKKLIAEARDIIVFQIGGTLEHIQNKIPSVYAAFLKAAERSKPAVASTLLTVTTIDDATNGPLESVSVDLISETTAKQAAQKTVKKAIKQSVRQKARASTKAQQSRTSTAGEVVLKQKITRGEVWAISKEGYETAIVTLPKLALGKSHTLEVRLTPIKA